MENKEVKSKFHSKKILVITDFGDMNEAREWREQIKTEAKLQDKNKMIRIFGNGFCQAPHGAHYKYS